MWRRRLSLWNILLLAGNCLVLLAIIHIWGSQEGPSAPSRPAKGPNMPVAPILRDQQPLAAFKLVAAKNLFSQDRTGPETNGADGKGQSSLEGRRLLGIVIVGEQRAALIGGPVGTGGKPKTEVEVVRLGEEWDGLKVVEISNEAVTFQGKEGKKTLSFPE